MSDDQPFPPTKRALDDVGGRALVEAWRASGLSCASYCREHNVRLQKLHYWRDRLGYPIRLPNGCKTSVASAPAPPAHGFVEVMVSPTTTATTDVDIFVGGVAIRIRPGFDPAFLRSVIAALSAQPC